MNFMIIIALVIVAFTWYYIKRRDFVKAIDKIPGPEPGLFSTIKFARRKPEDYLELAEKYGPIYRIWTGPLPIVVLTDPDDVKNVLYSDASKYDILKRNVLRPLLGEGLVLSRGAMWEKHRKLLNPAFKISILQKMVPIMVEVGEALVQAWKDKKPEEVVKVDDYLRKATLDIIGQAAFGTKFDSLSGKENELASALDFKLPRSRLWILILEKFYFFSKLPIPSNLQIRARMQRVLKVLKEVIDSRKSERFSQSNERDLLGILLNANENGVELSEQEIKDEATTFLFAGHETTAALLQWFFYELSQHPDVTQKLQDEIDSVLGGRVPTAEDLPKLKYLGMVINETFRLHPPVPMLGRIAADDNEVRGYTIPKGCMVSVAAYTVHLNEKNWRNAREFLPSRWENLNDEESKSFLPFSAGPRACIGRNFSLLEAKVLASMIIQNYELKLAKDQEITPVVMVTMTPSSLKMHISKRNKQK